MNETTTYLLTIETKTKGKVRLLLDYDAAGGLRRAELRDERTFTDRQLMWVWSTIPHSLERLLAMHDGNKLFSAKKCESDLSFDAFWELYGHKVGNKSRAEKYWNKLDDPTRIIAMAKVREYNHYMQLVTHAKIFPERWLSQRRWENDYTTATP